MLVAFLKVTDFTSLFIPNFINPVSRCPWSLVGRVGCGTAELSVVKQNRASHFGRKDGLIYLVYKYVLSIVIDYEHLCVRTSFFTFV